MISDVLSDATHQIREYLDSCDAYKNMDAQTGRVIYAALEAMEIARIRLDTPPDDSKAS